MRLISTSCGPPSEICGGNFPSIHLLIRFWYLCHWFERSLRAIYGRRVNNALAFSKSILWFLTIQLPSLFFFGELLSFLCEKTIHELESTDSRIGIIEFTNRSPDSRTRDVYPTPNSIRRHYRIANRESRTRIANRANCESGNYGWWVSRRGQQNCKSKSYAYF